jgi:hypothetical protein
MRLAFGLTIVGLASICGNGWKIIGWCFVGLVAYIVIFNDLEASAYIAGALILAGGVIYLGNKPTNAPVLRRFNNWMESRRLGKRIY